MTNAKGTPKAKRRRQSSRQRPTRSGVQVLQDSPTPTGDGADTATGPASLAATEQIAAPVGADEPLAVPTTGGCNGKKSQSTLLVELAQGAELWHTPGDGDAYASVRLAPVDSQEDDEPGDGGPVANWPVRSKAFRRWLARKFFLSYGKAPGSQALQDALNVIEGQAAFAGQERPVFVRVAGDDGRLYLDLANATWQAVEINAEGWRVIGSEVCPVRFRRGKAMFPLPTPTPSSDISELRSFVNVTDDDWPLLLGSLVAAFRPYGPYPVLNINGEQGSGKTTQARALRRLIDPNHADMRCEPREPRDLMIAANNGWIIALDNLSHLPGWLSDALCRLSTGGGFATRMLFSDDEEMIFDATRPVILTGIEELPTRGDLLDRSVMFQLPRIPEDRRLPEKEFWRDFEEAHGRMLGAVLDAVSVALRRLPETRIERLPRMADFAIWATAAEPGLGLQPGEFLAAYRDNRVTANEAALESSPVTKYVLQLAQSGDWQGQSSELLEQLEVLVSEADRKLKTWPKSARSLSGTLKRLAPNLREAGLEVDFGHEGRGRKKRRSITIRTARDSCVPNDANDPTTHFSVWNGGTGDADGRSGGARQPGGDDGGTQTAVDLNPSWAAAGTQGDAGDAELRPRSERVRVRI